MGKNKSRNSTPKQKHSHAATAAASSSNQHSSPVIPASSSKKKENKSMSPDSSSPHIEECPISDVFNAPADKTTSPQSESATSANDPHSVQIPFSLKSFANDDIPTLIKPLIWDPKDRGIGNNDDVNMRDSNDNVDVNDSASTMATLGDTAGDITMTESLDSVETSPKSDAASRDIAFGNSVQEQARVIEQQHDQVQEEEPCSIIVQDHCGDRDEYTKDHDDDTVTPTANHDDHVADHNGDAVTPRANHDDHVADHDVDAVTHTVNHDDHAADHNGDTVSPAADQEVPTKDHDLDTVSRADDQEEEHTEDHDADTVSPTAHDSPTAPSSPTSAAAVLSSVIPFVHPPVRPPRPIRTLVAKTLKRATLLPIHALASTTHYATDTAHGCASFAYTVALHARRISLKSYTVAQKYVIPAAVAKRIDRVVVEGDKWASWGVQTGEKAEDKLKGWVGGFVVKAEEVAGWVFGNDESETNKKKTTHQTAGLLEGGDAVASVEVGAGTGVSEVCVNQIPVAAE
ncbi:hypothetical protein BJ742DRAFT_810732 [Cladochytrium replicatum]|nr:hypothetical protein BJ742DRAFT_810732 [Cladochytrium replicatum]